MHLTEPDYGERLLWQPLDHMTASVRLHTPFLHSFRESTVFVKLRGTKPIPQDSFSPAEV